MITHGDFQVCESYETWYHTWCPYCDASNFHCNGDENDLSAVDVDGIRCRKCKKIYSLSGDEPSYIEDGILMTR